MTSKALVFKFKLKFLIFIIIKKSFKEILEVLGLKKVAHKSDEDGSCRGKEYLNWPLYAQI